MEGIDVPVNHNSESVQKIKNFMLDSAVGYFTLCGKRAFFIPKTHKTDLTVNESAVITALKVASYVTIVIPLLMLAIITFIPRPIPPILQPVSPSKENKKIYCFGDVHGELNGLIENLKKAKVVNQDGDWRVGNSSTIIQMGDVIDRGPQSVEAYQYLGKIQRQALLQSGKVIRLIGNHELMLMKGNYSYSNFNHPDQLAAQVKKDIIDGKVQAAYCDEKYIYVHGGLRSSIRKLLIEEIRELKGADYDVTGQDIVDHINQLLICAVNNNSFDHPIFGVGRSRGGDQAAGGVFWADFHELLRSRRARDIPQIVGHSVPNPAEPPIRTTDSLRLVDVDAGLCRCYGGRRAFIKVKEDAISIYEKINNEWRKHKRLF